MNFPNFIRKQEKLPIFNMNEKTKLYCFQKEIVELINSNKDSRILVLMARGGGKSFLFDWLTPIKARKENGISRFAKFNGTTFIDEVVDEYLPENPVVVFSSYSELLDYGEFDLIIKFDINRISRELFNFYDKDLVKFVPEDVYRRDFLCRK